MPRARNYTTGAVVTAATETVIATMSGITTHAGDTVDIDAAATVVLGTGTTAIVARIRRGTDATGALIGHAATFTGAATNTVGVSLDVSDQPPESQGLSYVLTVQQTGASANGTAEQAGIDGIWGI